ncbi:MAG TPA: DUF4402 domain-containing protein [Candidatus Kapabacteria bacterium]|nr:DUF4402 domain-containing protein [Candidatus Kapabacteria bacterium]
MKKFLSLAALAIVTCGAASAQTGMGVYGSSASATVSGTVTFPVTIARWHDLTLGTILRTNAAQNRSVDPHDATNAAHFKVLGDAGDLVNLTLDGTVTLTNDHVTTTGESVADGNTNTIMLTTVRTFRYVDGDQAGSTTWHTPFALAGNGYSDGGGSISGLDPGQGQMNVYVGGTYTIAADQQRGNYTGMLNASVAYAN